MRATLFPARVSALLPALFLVTLLGGCASTTEVITRSTTVQPTGPAHHLLLVAQTPEDDLRETWEITCRPIFERRGLTVSLSHQEIPLWQNKGHQALTDWAQQHGADRILLVNLTRLLLQKPNMPERRELNPLNQDTQVDPSIRVGIGGDYKKPEPPPKEQTYPVDLLNADGGNLWHGLARTHEANQTTAIAKSQCTALRDTLVKQGLLP